MPNLRGQFHDQRIPLCIFRLTMCGGANFISSVMANPPPRGKATLYGDDIVLTARGVAEAEAIAEALCDVAFDTAYSSDIARARQTAQIIVSARGIKVTPSNRFTEIPGDIATVLQSETTSIERQAQFAYASGTPTQPAPCFSAATLIASISTGRGSPVRAGAGG